MIEPAHAPFSVPPLKPHPGTLFAVTAIFNPRGYQSRYRLYRNFAKHMADGGVPLMTVEVALGDREFEITTPDNPWNLQLRTNADMWHKERALNLGIQRIIHLFPDAQYFAWIDADITFARPDWAQATLQKLVHHPVVQMFGAATNLDPNYHDQWTCKSAFREFTETRICSGDFYAHGCGGHPGLAWAITRKAYEIVGGLIDICISGGSDTHMANALRGDWAKGDQNYETITEFSDAFVNVIRIWADRAAKLATNIGYVPGLVLHHWHGNSFQRGHVSRWNVMQKHQFDPQRDIVLDANGLYKWAGNKPLMEIEYAASMSQRNEDGIDVFNGKAT